MGLLECVLIPRQTPMTISWSFDVRGIDLIGPLSTVKRGARIATVALKWIETEPLSTITAHQVVKSVIKTS